MTPSNTQRVLVLGATGPAGICLLRELLFRQYPTVVYARNPSKIPAELSSNHLLKVMKGEMDDTEALEKAMIGTSVILSLLGPNIADKAIKPDLFAHIYLSSIFPVMRKVGVRRIVAMGTISILEPEDRWTMFQFTVRIFMRFFVSGVYQNMQNLARAFINQAKDLDWTVFRIAQIPGESDAASWKRDRTATKTYAGPVGEEGWSSSIKRAAFTMWMVDNMNSDTWFCKMPALSELAK